MGGAIHVFTIIDLFKDLEAMSIYATCIICQ